MARIDKEKLFAQVGYQPHPGQLEIHLSPAKRRVVACGVRWGKSTAAVHEALAAVLAPTGPSRGWLVSPTFDTSDLILKRLFDLLETRFTHRVVSIDRRRRCAVITNLAGNQAEVSAKSASRPATLLGESLDWVILDEAARLKPEIWREHVSQRLVDRDGWALLASTPHEGGEWFEEEFDRCALGDQDFDAWTRPTWDNPAIDRAVIDAEKSRLSTEQFYREYGGEFFAPGGRICPTCRWGEVIDGRVLLGEQWEQCTGCPDCGRPLDADGKPIGVMGSDGVVSVNVYYDARGVSEVHIHRDPVLQSAIDAGATALT